MQARAAAAQVLARVTGGASLDTALPEGLARVAAGDRGLLGELCYGTLRWHPRLAALARQLLHRPLKARDADVAALLHLGLYQLEHTRVPAHAAVAETVAAAQALGKGWAKGLLNASLRRFQRERDALLAAADATPEGALAHPRWLLERLRDAWPDAWEAIAAANNAHPPMALRVNLARVDRTTCHARLAAAGHPATPLAASPAGLVLERPCDVAVLPGFAAGELSVQDGAAQLAAPLLAPVSGERVLDACAAPGGKTAHLAELAPDATLFALDRDPARLARVGENLDRTGGRAALLAADAGAPEGWWDGTPFDAVLLDAPCSATGVIRRHPDIKLLRRAADLPRLVAAQARLLAALWPLVAPGGRLLYATCSVLPEENDKQISNFLAAHGDAREDVIDADWGHARHHGRQILPGESGMDGFYYARLVRRGGTT